jgi:glycerol-3-phosphate dehydrogenase
MWPKEYRDSAWSELSRPWDIAVIGGGITGAGILREATRLGLRALLVEQSDFGWGTSSRSSKLVHGGLRYLAEGQVRMARRSVRERKRLLAEGPGLIDPLGFLIATYKGDHPGRWTYSAGLSVYDLLALQWSHRHYSAEELMALAPFIEGNSLQGGFRYGDAQTDDARLVLRVIQESVAAGGTALNYAAAEELLIEHGGVVGVRVCDRVQERTAEVRARVVVNATGAWADGLRHQVDAPPRIRPLRGSHLIFPADRLPVSDAVTFLHPIDRRPVFIFPWEGITLVGTTDVDHGQPLEREPGISADEVAYLMAAVEAQFPSLGLGLDDVISTFAGVRPVIGSGQIDPSKESRDHVVWEEQGLLTVTGGKLTTFRRIALDALKAVRHRLIDLPPLDDDVPALDPVSFVLPGGEALDDAAWTRLLGRYAADAPALVEAAGPGELEPIPGTQSLWAELRWAARSEAVVHLDDLLLRRVRLGHLLPRGGERLLPRVRAICQAELGWSDARWEVEEAAYLELWRTAYYLPDAAAVPDWRAMLDEARAQREAERPLRRRRRRIKISAAGAAIAALGVVGAVVAWRYMAHRRGVLRCARCARDDR